MTNHQRAEDESHLRAWLFAYAVGLRQRAENLVSADWDEAWKDMPATRQSHIGMAVEASIAADQLVEALGFKPRDIWPTKVVIPKLPPEERAQMRWTP